MLIGQYFKNNEESSHRHHLIGALLDSFFPRCTVKMVQCRFA